MHPAVPMHRALMTNHIHASSRSAPDTADICGRAGMKGD